MCSKTGLYLKRIVLDSQLQQIYKYSTTFTIHDVKLYYVYTETNWDMHKNTVHTVRCNFPSERSFYRLYTAWWAV